MPVGITILFEQIVPRVQDKYFKQDCMIRLLFKNISVISYIMGNNLGRLSNLGK